MFREHVVLGQSTINVIHRLLPLATGGTTAASSTEKDSNSTGKDGNDNYEDEPPGWLAQAIANVENSAASTM